MEEPMDAAPASASPFPEESGRRKRRTRRVILLSTISLLNLALLLLLWSQLLTPAHNQSIGGSDGPVKSPLVGKPAPDFTLPALSASPAPAIHLAALKGSFLVVNFWASWCDPCKQEAPILATKSAQVKGQGIQFVGIQFQDSRSNGLAFLRTYAVLYPNAMDTTGTTAIAYGITGVPETVFIDRRGIILRKVIGQLTMQTLQENLDLLRQGKLSQGVPSSTPLSLQAFMTAPISKRTVL